MSNEFRKYRCIPHFENSDQSCKSYTQKPTKMFEKNPTANFAVHLLPCLETYSLFVRMLFFRLRLEILIFPPILGWKCSSIVLILYFKRKNLSYTFCSLLISFVLYTIDIYLCTVHRTVLSIKHLAMVRDRSLFIAWRGGDLGLKKVKFSRSPLWMLLHWSDPPNNIWWLSRSPPPPP